jgi:uncharacterized protein YciW
MIPQSRPKPKEKGEKRLAACLTYSKQIRRQPKDKTEAGKDQKPAKFSLIYIYLI